MEFTDKSCIRTPCKQFLHGKSLEIVSRSFIYFTLVSVAGEHNHLTKYLLNQPFAGQAVTKSTKGNKMKMIEFVIIKHFGHDMTAIRKLGFKCNTAEMEAFVEPVNQFCWATHWSHKNICWGKVLADINGKLNYMTKLMTEMQEN